MCNLINYNSTCSYNISFKLLLSKTQSATHNHDLEIKSLVHFKLESCKSLEIKHNNILKKTDNIYNKIYYNLMTCK